MAISRKSKRTTEVHQSKRTYAENMTLLPYLQEDYACRLRIVTGPTGYNSVL